MTQEKAVLETIKNLGGVATLEQLYRNVFSITECTWKTKTPFASIRRIVQQSSELYKIKPGLYALKDMKASLEKKGVVQETDKNKETEIVKSFNHSYYQGLLLTIGNLRGFKTFAPNQDKNKFCSNNTIGELRTLNKIPCFSYQCFVSRCATIDTIWFNERNMPSSFFEVEYSTDIQNSLLKFSDLQDFSSKMYIVADEHRREEFIKKIHITAFSDLEKQKRVSFLSYDDLEKAYFSEIKRFEIRGVF